MKEIKHCVAPVSYFPPLHYFAALLVADNFSVETHENYQKSSFRNRCTVVTSQGETVLSIPLTQGKNEQQPITQVQISNETRWQNQHWATLKTAYGSAPFWEHYAQHIEKFFKTEQIRLYDVALQSTLLCADLIHPDLKNKIKTTDVFKSAEIHTDYFFLSKFAKSKGFQTFGAPKYAQVFEDRNGFVPYASILDVLMCHGRNSLAILYRYAETF